MISKQLKIDREKLLTILEDIDTALDPLSEVSEIQISEHINQLIRLFKTLKKDLLPYSAVTQFVYDYHRPDISTFIDDFEEEFYKYCPTRDMDLHSKFAKLMSHFDLAIKQRDSLYKKQEKEIIRIKNQSSLLDEKLKLVDNEIQKLKQQTEEFNKQSKEVKDIEKRVVKVKKQVKNVTSQFISILGIFAAIMIGSFGAIQAFSDLFKNAQNLDLGKLLVISSVGASSVILILFFLLNTIAKLTDRDIASSKNKEDSFLIRYPILFISFGIIFLIALIGAAMLLINYQLQRSWYGLWWGLPVIWGAYFGLTLYYKSPKLWKNSKIKNDKTLMQHDVQQTVTSDNQTNMTV